MNESEKNRREKIIKEEYEKRKEAEKKAHRIIQQLIDKNISEDFFLLSVKSLTPEHYGDVVEERSITGSCGYCLCNNILGKVLQQKYKISKNKVYDITERKKFCSDACFAKSQHIVSQISSAPLWTRDTSSSPDVKTLDSSAGLELKGEEVKLRHVIPREVVDEPEGLSDEVQEKQMEPTNVELAQDACSISAPLSALGIQNDEGDESVKNKGDLKSTGKPAALQIKKTVPAQEVDLVAKTLDILREWLTEKSLIYLGIGTARGNARRSEEPSRSLEEGEYSGQKKLDQPLTGRKPPDVAKPVPDYRDLRQDVDVYARKVESFLLGAAQEKKQSKTKDMKDEGSFGVSLPTADTLNQNQIRQKIVGQRLLKMSTDLSVEPGLLRECRQFVGTFSLTNKNVMLPAEIWPLMTVSILLLLSKKSPELKESLKSSGVYISMILKSYKLDASRLEYMLATSVKQHG